MAPTLFSNNNTTNRNLFMRDKSVVFFNYVKKLASYFFERVVYFNYRLDISLLSYLAKGPRYFIFLFAYFFGFFGSTDPFSPGLTIFKYLCFVFSYYVISVSLFVFLSFQIPSVKRYLYRLLGEKWVTDRIGNHGASQVVKFGVMALAGLAVNEYDKFKVDESNKKAATMVIDNYIKVIKESGQKLDINSDSCKEALRLSNEILSRPAKGFVDTSQERLQEAVSTMAEKFSKK